MRRDGELPFKEDPLIILTQSQIPASKPSRFCLSTLRRRVSLLSIGLRFYPLPNYLRTNSVLYTVRDSFYPYLDWRSILVQRDPGSFQSILFGLHSSFSDTAFLTPETHILHLHRFLAESAGPSLFQHTYDLFNSQFSGTVLSRSHLHTPGTVTWAAPLECRR